MLAWWWELREVPSQDDIKEFARRAWASFQVPKVRCHAMPGYVIWRPGLLAEAASEDPDLCKGPPTLGGKSPATNHR